MAIAYRKSIKDLRGEKFFIPSYQRGYRWSEADMKALEKDLYDYAMKNNEGSSSDYYCLQPIVVAKRDNGMWEVVDGQQRLTSLWLLSAMYHVYHSEERWLDYSLYYEKKDELTALLTKIRRQIEISDEKGLKIKDFLDKAPGESFDAYNIIQNMKLVANTKFDSYSERKTLSKVFDKGLDIEEGKDIQIIWYELDEEEGKNPIQMFTNINANKIELTEAELVKAAMMHNLSNEHEKDVFALKWEEIEKGLNNDSLWKFIVGDGKYQTKIDYMFDIWYEINRDTYSTERSDHFIFDAVAESIEKGQLISFIWKQIQEIYETIQDWYQDYTCYHLIGLLVELAEIEKSNSSPGLIKDLFEHYTKEYSIETGSEDALDRQAELVNNYIQEFLLDNQMREQLMERCRRSNGKWYLSPTREDFTTYLKSKIRNFYSRKWKISCDSTALCEKLNDPELNYKDKPQPIRAILLLYNIAILLNSKNKYERFPFDLYKEQKHGKGWELEHVNPQNPKENSDGDKIEWLKSYLDNLRKGPANCQDVIDSIEECFAPENSGVFQDKFNVASSKLENYLSEIGLDTGATHQIKNLVLLDAGTNRGYHNDCFTEKRKKIFQVERNEHNAEAGKDADIRYIMPGTRWVFFKEYGKADQLLIWNFSDMEEYIKDIVKNISKALNCDMGGNNDGDE